MAIAQYGVAIIGFKCIHETKDDMLEGDGKRDEVFFLHQVQRVSGIDGKVVSSENSRTSRVMGDTNGFPGRIRAGTGDGPNGRGGIRSSDQFPAVIPVGLNHDSPKNDDYPPYKIGEYELAEGTGDTYFITVTLWEWDSGQSIVKDMTNWLATIDTTYGKTAKDIFTKVYPPNAVIFDAVSLGIQTLKTIVDIAGTSESRPIGLAPASNQAGNKLWGKNSPMVIALNYESAEYLCAQDDVGMGRGVLSHTLMDDPRLEGHYEIYLKFYKIAVIEDDSAEGLTSSTKTFAIDASNRAFLGDGGATVCGFVATSSTSEDILATVTGWQPGGANHPASVLVKRANQNGRPGIWFRVNFVDDKANGVVWIALYQGGNPIFGSPEATAVTFDGQPWH